MNRIEAGQPLWKRLAYVAITRAQERLIWVVRNRLSKPTEPLRVDDLKAIAAPTLTLAPQVEEDGFL
jgi:exodeoxyribonuclease-5